MILKIFPIYAADGESRLRERLEYVCNAQKTTMRRTEFWSFQQENAFSSEFVRDIEYDAAQDEVLGRFVSGYRCSPKTALRDFAVLREILGVSADGVVAYHIVQSTSAKSRITAEGMHACGCELIYRLGGYPAVIGTHARGEFGDDDLSHGDMLHNHILIAAYRHPAYSDPEHPGRLKLNVDRAFTEQMRVWNDTIAIDHGLPITGKPDTKRYRSWTEAEAIKRGDSWKEAMRHAIEEVRDASSDWEDFLAGLALKDLRFTDGTFTTYTTEDGKHICRATSLGRDYTREALSQHWKEIELRTELHKKFEKEPLLNDFALTHPGHTVRIPIGCQHKKYYSLSLERDDLDTTAINSYFDPHTQYLVYDADGVAVAAFWGAELRYHYEQYDLDFRRADIAAAEKERQIREEEQRYRERQRVKELYHLNSRGIREAPCTHFYDDNGQPITRLQAIFQLAIVLILRDSSLWVPSTTPPDRTGCLCYTTPDRKTQRMLDSIAIARKENISCPAELERELANALPAYHRAKSMVQWHQMEKERLQEEYTQAASCVPPDKKRLWELKNRLAVCEQDIVDWMEVSSRKQERYRNLRELSYNLALTENAYFCHGPYYPGEEKAGEIVTARNVREKKARSFER